MNKARELSSSQHHGSSRDITSVPIGMATSGQRLGAGKAPEGCSQRKQQRGWIGLTGTTIVKRFWVRGHWRRPHSSWQDQRVRWTAPYLKGPDVAAIVEQEYALGAMDP